jgi:uncharacterized protein (TIGR03067 family)
VDKKLPARPNLDHLRGQAKKLLAQHAEGDAAARRAFAELGGKKTAFKLADAQSVIARQNGFASWAQLTRHVEQLRGLEGAWQIERLEIDGTAAPSAMVAHSRILFDGDRFRTESPEGTYEGVFSIDAEATPPALDIEFVVGPEAGNKCFGLYRIDGPDALTLCLGLVGSARPREFATRPGSGHALEQLRRVSTARPANVTGGTPPVPPPDEPVAELGDPRSFEVAITPIYERLQGEWAAVELVTEGKPAPEQWLTFGSRTMTGNELKVVFGGQTMVHAKVRIDESVSPIAVDYLNLVGRQKGRVSHGIMKWVGDEARFLMAHASAPRPASFAETKGTLTRWRRR